MMASQKPRTWEAVFWPAITLLLLGVLWRYAVVWTGTRVFPSPAEVAVGILELLHQHVLWADILSSLARVLTGFGAAVVIGVPLGLLLGSYLEAYRVLTPVLELLRPISPIAWIPVAILLFGVGNGAAVFLVFLAAFFPIVLATVTGVARVPAIYRDVGRNFALSPWQLQLRVVLPAALPQIFIGLRIALGIAWLVVVAAEMIAVDSGLGYLILDSRNSGKRYDLVVAAMLLIGVIGLGLDIGMRRLERLKAVRWGFGNAHRG